MWKRILIALALASLALALSYCQCNSHSAQETLTVDNLVAQTSIQLNSSTASKILATDGSKKFTTLTDVSCAGGSAITTAGGTGFTCGGPFAAGSTASISLTNGAPPASVNFSTEGTVDWFIVNNSNLFSGNWLINNLLNNSHTKRGNGHLLLAGWGNVGGMSITTANYGTTMTSTAGDDSTNAGASSTGVVAWFGNTTGGSWNTCAQADNTPLKLRVYGTFFGSTITTTAHLTLSGTTQTDSFSVPGGVSPNTDKLETITFTGGIPGEFLCINVQMTATSNGSMSLGGMTLGPT